MFRPLKGFINQQAWLDSAGDPLQRGINSIFARGGAAGKVVQNFLNGVWIGHPFHPLLTDVPVGAWTVTVVLDTIALVTGKDTYRGPGEVALAVGLAAALAAAVTGTTDWKDTYGEERRLGLLHGLLMVATTTLFAVALVLHLTGPWLAGVVIGYVGYVLMSAGAYLGGDEVFEIGYGVNHTAFQHGPDDYVPVMAVEDLTPGTPARADAAGIPILLVNLDGQIYALDDTCVHAGCSLADGKLEAASVVCSCHGSQFDLRDGSVINGPATMPQPHYDVRLHDGMIEVKQALV